MKICAVTVPLKSLDNPPACDVCLFGFNALGDVDYESELSGKTDKFGELAKFSKAGGFGVVCGCKTDSRGLKRKSVAVADRGRLLGISDMLHVLDGEEYKSGAGLGVYQTGGYKIGVCVENDLYFPENVKALTICGCNLIAVQMESVKDNMPPLLIRAYAYLYGVPVVMCAGKTAYFADVTGAMASSTQSVTLFETDPKNFYRVISTRRRGLWQDCTDDY